MFNSIRNLIQFGNNTQTTNISINPKIDVSIKRVKKDFFNGNFKQAIEDLNSLIEDNSSEALKIVKYQLLLLKIDFLLQFRKIDEFKELIELIENKYSNELSNDSSIKFQEFKLTLMAFDENTDFFELSKQLRINTPNSKPQGHFDIVFYLNSGNLEKARKIFEEEIKNTEFRNKLLLIGGHIYSNLYEHNEIDIDIFNYADNYYKEALEKEELSFLEKLQIQGFYATYLLNNNLQNKISKKELLYRVEDYKISLDTILENKEYFDTNYIKITIENYIHILSYLGLKDEYYKFYNEHKESLEIKHYIQYCGVKNIEYKHNTIQKYILNNYKLTDLLVYSSLILESEKENIEQIINFLEQNDKFLYEHNFIIYSYIKGKLILNSTIEAKIISYLKINKYNDLDTLLAFIEQIYKLNNSIENDDIRKLIELSLSDNNSQARILDIIKLLKKFNKRKEYIDLALSKQNIFTGIIFETLKICEKDENLSFTDFEYFINNIDKKDNYSAIIGNIYFRYDKQTIAFEYYYKEYSENKTLEIMFILLQTVLINYHKNNKIIKNQVTVFNALIFEVDNLSLEQLFFLLQYSIKILNDTKQILPIINQKLLTIDIENLDNNIKIMLSNFYIQTRFEEQNFQNLFLHDNNRCLYSCKTIYITNDFNISEKNKNNFSFLPIDEDEYFLKSNDNKKYHTESLIHKICEPFAFISDNPNIKSIDVPEKVLDLIEEDKNYKKDLFEEYSKGANNIGLFILAQNSYKNYFTLIPYLLNNNLQFNSLQINYLPTNIKKILTFSSILLLNEIGQLDKILKRDDILIQKSLTNWLQKYLDEISFSNMPIDITYLDEKKLKFIPYTHESKKEAENFKTKVSSMLIKLLNCDKIDDTSENLPIKEAYTHLAPYIGNQEYQALATALNHNYQIVSENNIFDMLSNLKIINKTFTTNSISLLMETLDKKYFRSLILDLHNKNYKYLLNNWYINNLFYFMKRYNVCNLLIEEKQLIKIANSYGLLDKMIKYYNHKFKVLYPKRVLPRKTFFDHNIEKIIDIINNNEEVKCKN